MRGHTALCAVVASFPMCGCSGGGATNAPSALPDATASDARDDADARSDASADGSSAADGDGASVTDAARGTTRDPRYWPFSVTSPWNTPIGSHAEYAPVAGLSSLTADLNFGGVWTTAVAIAKASDPIRTVYVNPNSNWNFVSANGKVCADANADTLLTGAVTTMPFHSNPYSTPPSGPFHDAQSDWNAQAHVPDGACASGDTDAHLAIYQPNGSVLEMYAAVRTSTGDVVTTMASYVDPTGDGTGAANGRKASMFPDFAGLVRTGEIARGLIPHALVATLSATILTKPEVWPALAYDQNDGYSGTLPMGSLLAIPPTTDVATLGLSAKGLVLARAAQDFGIYVGDRGGAGGLTIQAELGDPDLGWPEQSSDMTAIVRALQRVTNNTVATPGGGGTPRAAPAPPLR